MKRKHPLPTTPEQYAKLQDRAGFTVGDTVLITRQADGYANGWRCGWNPRMNINIGKTGTIKGIDTHTGIIVETDDSKSWWYPYFTLKKVPNET